MTHLSIRTADNRVEFEPGERIDIVAEWSLQSNPQAMEIRMVWHTEGKGDTDLGVADTIVIANPRPSDTHRDSIVLPLQPYSFSGKLISLIWGLELVAVPSEESSRIGITIAPGRQEIDLSRHMIEE